MSATKEEVLAELAEYEVKLTAIESRFKHTRDAIWIAEGDDQLLVQYVGELDDLLHSFCGGQNKYSHNIVSAYNHGITNMYHSPSLDSVRRIIAHVRAAQTNIKRASFATPSRNTSHFPLVAEQRLTELRSLASGSFDFCKLIRLCEELNVVYRNECYYATAMLIRSMLDHVPPLFGMRSFHEIANNYGGGGKSFKDAMQGLEAAAKKVADGHLHQQIRQKESLPTAQQVNFSAPLDALLGEVVRIS